MSDYYSVLGVSFTQHLQDIKKAFHKLALKHHPEPKPKCTAAYEVLSDREKRQDMDSNPFVDKGTFHGKRGFQHFSLEELLYTLRMDDDVFMSEQPGYEEWSFIFGPDDNDETVLLCDLFNML
uniref:J domain-containing protein n=1 Tax=Sinocyclocheilus rhinocerous TaxID=307959 RepID=A0A673I7K0_9TELE